MAYIICHLFSKYLAHETSVSILLPDISEGIPEGGYKVLYLLHGRGDDCTSWVRNSRIERYAKENRTVYDDGIGRHGMPVDDGELRG